MKISAVVPVYNTEKYLRKCLESIVFQNFDDFELLIVNDGSTDNSEAIIKDFLNRFDNISYFKTENLGVHNARNIGLDNARGDYIIFIDSDDFIDKNTFLLMYKAITENNCDMAVCNFAKTINGKDGRACLSSEDGNATVSVRGDDFVRKTLREIYYLGACVFNKMFSTELIRSHGIRFESRNRIYAEDAHFYYRLISAINSYCFVDEVLYHYVQHTASFMHQYKSGLPERVQNFITELDSFYSGYNFEISKSIRILCFNLWIYTAANEHSGGYVRFKSFLQNEFFYRRLSELDTRHYPKRRRVLYRLYKRKRFRLLYILFKAVGSKRNLFDKMPSENRALLYKT